MELGRIFHMLAFMNHTMQSFPTSEMDGAGCRWAQPSWGRVPRCLVITDVCSRTKAEGWEWRLWPFSLSKPRPLPTQVKMRGGSPFLFPVSTFRVR